VSAAGRGEGHGQGEAGDPGGRQAGGEQSGVAALGVAAQGNDSGAMAVGAQLVTAFGDLQAGDRPVVVVVDDLHWSDELSARALLFALRRMRADRVLGLVAARTGGLDDGSG
jgi:hypothetical protein